MKKITILSFSLFLIASFLMFSCGSEKKEIKEQSGEELVNQLWTYLQNSDTTAADSFMLESFQVIHEDGASNKEQELQLIAGLNIDTYNITNLICTQNKNVIVATYIVSVEETINGERLSKAPAARMSVFMEDEGTWKWISHANLKPLEQISDSLLTVSSDSIIQ